MNSIEYAQIPNMQICRFLACKIDKKFEYLHLFDFGIL